MLRTALVLSALLACAPAPLAAREDPPHPALDAFRTAIEKALSSGHADAALTVIETFRAPALHTRLSAREALRAVSLPPPLLQAEADARTAVRRARAALRAARRQGGRRALRQASADLQAAQATYRSATERGLAYAEARVAPKRPATVTAPVLRASLAEHEAWVHYVLHPERAWALVTTRADTRIVDLGGTAGLHEALASLQIEQRAQAWEGPLEVVRQLLVVPLGLPSQVQQVWVVPAGRMHAAALALIFGDRDVVRLPSASIGHVLRGTATVPHGRILGLGDPDYRAHLRYAPLPSTRKEVDAVADVRLVAAEASEGTLARALTKEPRWRAVHLACHAQIDERQGLQSAMILSPDEAHDGVLSAFEILRLRVSCDLATLSTVRSLRGAVDEVEGLEGLAPAFLQAGARAVLGSLWSVDDEATAALMIRFYQLWRPRQGEGLPADDALRLAREHVRLQPRWKHPYYWAAWELYGVP